MTENKDIRNSKSKRNISKKLFPIFSLISAALVLVMAGIAMITFMIYFYIWLPSVLCVTGAVLTLAIIFLLDKNAKFSEKFQIKNFNLRWLIIVPLSFLYSIITDIVLFILSDQSITLDTEAGTNFVVFLVGSLLLNFSVYLLYFGIKNLKSVEIHRLKFGIFKTLTVFFLVLSCGGVIFFYFYFIQFPPPNILGGTGYDDGPWLTWYDNKPDENICITWLTAESNFNSELKYGTNPNDLDEKEVGSGEYLHKVYLEGLKPNTTYYYKISDISKKVYSFKTASDKQEAFKLAILGDMQPANPTMIRNGRVVAKGIDNGSYDFVMQLGDIADSGSEPYDWHRALQNVAIMGAERPFQAAIGNHDWSGGVGSSNWAELFTYNYQYPNLGRFYSFDYHNAHFIMIDNFEHFYKMSKTQLEWLIDDIKAAKDDGQDWIFCSFHLSMMTTATSGMYYYLQEMLVPIFDKNGVDAVFFAHDHDYQHYNYTYGQNGFLWDEDHDWKHNEVHYFCSGGGGANLEVDYGVLEKSMRTTDTVEWWDTKKKEYRTVEYEIKEWDSNNYITHPTFPDDYAWHGGDYEGKYYYHLTEEESYHEFAEDIGFEYGEQTYHFIEIAINGSECTISVKYPNGILLQGPGNAYRQQWVFNK